VAVVCPYEPELSPNVFPGRVVLNQHWKVSEGGRRRVSFPRVSVSVTEL
jgi:hypothetical protein